MTYNLQWTSQLPGYTSIGKSTIVIPDETTNSSTSLVLVGAGELNFGAAHQQDFMWLLENFASAGTHPANPTIGQQWYDTSTQTMSFYNGTTWTALVTDGASFTAGTANSLTAANSYTVAGLSTTGSITSGAGVTAQSYISTQNGSIGNYNFSGGSGSTWYNAGWRNDGTTIYLLQSSAQTTQALANSATWNTYRPFSVSLSTGAVSIDGGTGPGTGAGTTFGGDVTINGANTALIVNSTNSSNIKLAFQDAGTVRGYIGAESAHAFYVINAGNSAYVLTVDNSGNTVATGTMTATNFIGPGTGLTGTGASFTAGTANSLTTANSYTVAGLVATSALNLPQWGGTNMFKPGTADGASYTSYDVNFELWYGLGMSTYDGSVNGYYDARFGVWDTKGGFKVNGVAVPTVVGTGASGTWGISITGGANSALTATNATNASFATNAGEATTLNINGTACSFVWAGQAGQPFWLWGGNALGTMDVWNPSNFSVNYATTSGTANALNSGNGYTMAGLQVNGNINATGYVAGTSDESVKTNWRPLPTNYLENLVKVKYGIYDRTDIDLTQAGVSAQDMQKILSQVVRTDDAGKLALEYANAAMVTVIALTERVLELEAKLASLTNA